MLPEQELVEALARIEKLEAERDGLQIDIVNLKGDNSDLREAAQAVVDNPSAVNLSVLALALEADDE